MGRIPNYANLGQITLEDIIALIENGVAECSSLDYKSATYKKDQAGNKEWCKDISAMANTEGGCIIIGVEEENNIPKHIIGIDDDPSSIIDGLHSSALGGVIPRISINDRIVLLSNGRHVILMATPRSLHGPHRNTCQDEGRYHRRSGSVSTRMDHNELHIAFSQSEQQLGEIQDTHDAWMKIRHPVDRTSVSLSVFPLPSQLRYEPYKHLGNRLPLCCLPRLMGDLRPVFEGMHCERDGLSALLRRDGSASYRYFGGGMNKHLGCALSGIEILLVVNGLFKQIHELYSYFSWSDPFILCGSIFAPLNTVFHNTFESGEPANGTIPQGKYQLDVIYFENVPDRPIEATASWLHHIWNLAGLPNCQHFNKDGRFITPSSMR